MPLVVVFQGAAVLTQQAMLENNYQEADRLLADMFRWSHLLRHSQPNLLQATISRYGWKSAFNVILLDWPGHPDQAKRLAEIEQLHASQRFDRAELMETLKSEARWSFGIGGIRNMLNDEKYAVGAMMFMKPPFDKLTAAELLKLPYDADADFRRDTEEMLGILECLKNGTPMVRWPGFEIPVTGHSIKDYTKRPNGLGDLFREQSDSAIRNGVWSNALSHGPLLDACLHWLRLEQEGKPVDESQFTAFLDPVDGKPMEIDVKLRTIRSRGPNRKTDPREPALGPLPAAGFSSGGDDPIIFVPGWRSGVTEDASKIGGK